MSKGIENITEFRFDLTYEGTEIVRPVSIKTPSLGLDELDFSNSILEAYPDLDVTVENLSPQPIVLHHLGVDNPEEANNSPVHSLEVIYWLCNDFEESDSLRPVCLRTTYLGMSDAAIITKKFGNALYNMDGVVGLDVDLNILVGIKLLKHIDVQVTSDTKLTINE